MATGRKQTRKNVSEEKVDKNIFGFTEEEKKRKKKKQEEEEEEEEVMSGSEEEARADESPKVDKGAKKRTAAEFDLDEATCAVGNEVQSMLNKVMRAKKNRLESLTKSYMKGSQHKMEQLWNNYHSQRQKMSEQYSQHVNSALQQWEVETHQAEEQEQKLNNLFRQQQKIVQQARLVQNQKLKTVRELFQQFVKNMEDMEKSHDAFLQGAQQELRKEMATLQKKILMDTQQQERATVRKSLQSMLF